MSDFQQTVPEPSLRAEFIQYLPPLLQLMRPHQWIKNLFVAAPLFFTPTALSWEMFFIVLTGFACFSALSSGIYIFNDYMDRDADRLHPEKCKRPLAAGTVSVRLAFTAMALLALGGLLNGLLLNPAFGAILAFYTALNLAYSVRLKHIAILDVMIIALGFVLRVEAGAALVGLEPSVWMIVCTGLLALFLAIAKRRDDVVRTIGAAHRKSLEGFNKAFLDSALTMVMASVFITYALYTTDANVMERLGTQRLYVTLPFVMAGLLRYLQVTMVEERSGSPTKVVLSDPFLITTVVGWITTFGVLIYL